MYGKAVNSIPFVDCVKCNYALSGIVCKMQKMCVFVCLYVF